MSNLDEAIRGQQSALAEKLRAERKEAVEKWAELAPFAKLVVTHDGPGILIGDSVIVVRSANPSFHAEAIVQALRAPAAKGG